MKNREFSWPYPKTTDQLIQVAMVTAAVIMALLLFFARLTHSYQTRVIDRTHIQGVAETLYSIASQADILAEQSLKDRSTQSYEEALAHNLSEETEETLTFLDSHQANKAQAVHRTTLIKQAHMLQEILHTISSKPADTGLRDARLHLQSVLAATEKLQ